MPINAFLFTGVNPRPQLFDEPAIPKVQAVMGMLLPAVQKVREAAARLS